MKITVIILTMNEELHLARCLESVSKIADEVIVVDSGSLDKTVDIAKQFGCIVYHNSWKNYSEQFEFGVSVSNMPWILRIDADEYLDNVLVDSIEDIKSRSENNACNGYYLNRLMCFGGERIRYGGLFPVKVIRLYRREFGRIEQRWMDEHIVVTGPTGELRGSLTDNNLKPLTWWIEKHNSYAIREAVDHLSIRFELGNISSTACLFGKEDKFKRYIKDKIYYKFPSGVRVGVYYFYRMVIRAGIFDNAKARQFHFLQGCWYRYMVDCRITSCLQKIDSGLDPRDVIEQLLEGQNAYG